ncbi:Tm-1-like ATP-binding domain-containing protein [Rhodococcoides fascians]|uniref:Tm-1-like ATP-binding domain-containing protein n=1 Tax=Rhodococcoides fascians TaxID=1828 RepID=UPI001E4F9552|nr:Tm-1-like ATP-binding domain-containing protein [Rhodococcus fascians]
MSTQPGVQRMSTVVLLATLDTKGYEAEFLRDRLLSHDVNVIVLDTGVFEPVALTPDVSRYSVADAAGAPLDLLARAGDRGNAVTAMGAGAAITAQRLHREGRLDALLAIGGGGGSSIAAQAMQSLPLGVPKLLVSTLASGDTRPYVGTLDVTLMHSVVDLSGINQISARILSNAAAATAGMAKAPVPEIQSRPVVAASMFGVTTDCVTRAQAELEKHGFEVLVFHQTGTGGQTMDELVSGGYVRGVLDVTTTELADELVGGVLPAHPARLRTAGPLGIPQVVSLGALDMVNFGPKETVPDRFRGRTFYEHNPTVTLMRTTTEECAELGRRIATRLNESPDRTVVFVPLQGLSSIDREGQPFFAPDADAALFGALREHLSPQVELHELDLHINDSAFAHAMVARLQQLIEGIVL